MNFATPLLSFLVAAKYPLIFFGCYIEGTVVMLTTGLLWHSGVVAFWPAYAALLLGDFLSDLMWYAIGYFGARKFMNRWGHYIGATPEVVKKIEDRFHAFHTSILIVSKLSMGFGFAVATLTTAGMMRIPLSRYITINLLGGIVWVFAAMLVGYYFGNVLEYIPQNLQVGIGVAGIVAAIFGLRYASKQIAQTNW